MRCFKACDRLESYDLVSLLVHSFADSKFLRRRIVYQALKKAHFLYDKYTCDSHPLSEFEGAPLYVLPYHNEQTDIEYFFIPIVRVLESRLYTTDTKPVTHLEFGIEMQTSLSDF